MNLNHNHEVSKSAFGAANLSEEEKEVVLDLNEANCKVSQICRVMKKKFDKNLSSQKLRIMIRTFTSQHNNDSDKERLQHSLEGMEEQEVMLNMRLVKMEMFLFYSCHLRL